MSVREEIAKLPGGASLAALVDKVNGRPADIRDVAIRWRGLAGKVNEHIGSLRSAVVDVDNNWEGESANAFDVYMRNYSKANTTFHGALLTCAGLLDTAATALEEAKSKVNTLCDNVLADHRVTVYRNSTSEAERKKAEPGALAAVNGALSTAGEPVSSADEAVSKAMKEIKKTIDDESVFFAIVKAPGDQEFTPGQGRTFDWRRTTGPDPSHTTLASTNGGGAGPAASPSLGGGSGGSSGSGGSGSGGPAVAAVCGRDRARRRHRGRRPGEHRETLRLGRQRTVGLRLQRARLPLAEQGRDQDR
ncbi:WXG100 family type VII secretion target [Streptosporangium sp. NBC_01495]|uniref:WXG100 family type VII secretion target n=1 Tax=Streptosporangium sp. NBC_01495 TaxID=2903899 RepID=UPI002E366B3C|nr:WXG100 family type VII secretion target [Streptosporangium sp. NBC_01495]